MDTECIQDVSSLEPQVRLGKSSLVESSKDKSRTNVLDDGFHEFWNHYPKKVGKDAAHKAWTKKKPKIDEVIKALSWQVESMGWTKSNGDFIPNPATYLNDGRWKDEPVKEGAPF